MQILNNYNFNYSNYNKVGFEAKPKLSGNQIKPAGSKRFLPKALAVMIPLCILAKMCNTEDRISCKADRENYNVEYFNVKKSTKDCIEKSLTDFEKRYNANELLAGTNIDVTKMYADLDTQNAYRKHSRELRGKETVRGSSFYSDGFVPCQICIQEGSHKYDRITNKADGITYGPKESMEFTLMHELGHQFDKFYGHNKNDKFAIEREKMHAREAQIDSALIYQNSDVREDIIIENNFYDNSGLSDKSEFKEAYLKDLKRIAEIKKNGDGDLAFNLEYFTARIDFNKEINEKLVKLCDGNRAETYANLFAYVVGENDGDKDTFVSNFSNCYEVVKNDVQKYLGK